MCLKSINKNNLREQAWSIQNRLSGRTGISKTVELPDDVKKDINKLCNKTIALCIDYDDGYVAPEDFRKFHNEYEAKLRDVQHLLDNYEKVVESVKIKDKLPEPANPVKSSEVQFESSAFETGDLDQAKNRIADGSHNLSNLGLSDGDLESLLAALRAANFEELNLNGNKIRDAGVQSLVVALVSGFENLKFLDISMNEFGNAGKSALTEGLCVIRPDIEINF